MRYNTPFKDIIAEILDKYLNKYSDTPSRTLGRMLKRDYPELFKSIDAARSCVRYRRGKNGKFCLHYLRDKKYVKV